LPAQSVGELAKLELLNRQKDAITLFRPLPIQEQFLRCSAKNRLVIGSNQAGKTMSTVVELAMIVTGRHPYLDFPKENGLAVVVGKNFDEIGITVAPKLLRDGPFKIIYDVRKKSWRPYMPDNEWDKMNVEAVRPASALLPARFVKEIGWEDKKQYIPRIIKLHNGWEIRFYSSEGIPPAGFSADYVLFDEEIVNRLWYPEMAARLIYRGGRFVWGATPQNSTEELLQLYYRSMDMHSSVKCFELQIIDNPYISQEEKEEFRSRLLTEDQVQVRWYGKFARLQSKVYPEFSESGPHCIDPVPIEPDWTRYVAIDPGRQVCAAVFIAVSNTGEVHVYDEIYQKRSDAARFGEEFRSKVFHVESSDDGQRTVADEFEAFVIDGRMGRQTQMTTGRTIEEHYSEVLARNGISSRLTGSGFFWGSMDPSARTEDLREWLRIGANGKPILRIHKDKCPNLVWEIQRQYYVKKRGSGLVTDKRVDENNHAVTCLEYLAALKPCYRFREKEEQNPIYKLIREFLGIKPTDVPSIVLGPPVNKEVL